MSRARAAAAPAEPRLCAQCGRTIPPERRSDAAYCSSQCSDAARYARRRSDPELRERHLAALRKSYAARMRDPAKRERQYEQIRQYKARRRAEAAAARKDEAAA